MLPLDLAPEHAFPDERVELTGGRTGADVAKVNAGEQKEEHPPTIAALFVERNGAYASRPGVDCWDVKRDARSYTGPWPVVAHPPCERWGCLWAMGGPESFGQDQGCFEAALCAVEQWGGVLEHPADSGARAYYGLPEASRAGGWTRGARGWSCIVEQGHYGHRAPKATWLYYVGSVAPPALTWGPSAAAGRVCTLTPHQRRATPEAFASLLLDLARSSRLEWRGPAADVSRDVRGQSVAELEPPALFPRRGRRCDWCDKPLPADKRSHALTCSKWCRQHRQRWTAQGRPPRVTRG